MDMKNNDENINQDDEYQDPSTSTKSLPDPPAMDSSYAVDRDSLVDEASNCSTNITEDKDQENMNRKVEKVLKMRFKRGMKQYLIHWHGTESSSDSWHFLDQPFEGFFEQVQIFEEERKKLNLKGIGQSSDTLEQKSAKSSKGLKRAKHSWYYLSSSEDEDCMLKDNFWKNLDEGKLDIYQASSDLYSGVKEAGRGAKSTNQKVSCNSSSNRAAAEVSAIMPEEFLAETKRLTRSRVMPTKLSRASKSPKSQTTNDVIANNSTETKKTTKKKRGPKLKKEKKQKIIKKKNNNQSVSLTSIKSSDDEENDDEDDDDDDDIEDDINSMLVKSKMDNDDDVGIIENVTNNQNLSPNEKDITSNSIPNATAIISNCDLQSENEVVDIKKGKKQSTTTDVSRSNTVVLEHLDQTLDTVVKESLAWYEMHFASDEEKSTDDEDDDHDTSDSKGKNDTVNDNDDDNYKQENIHDGDDGDKSFKGYEADISGVDNGEQLKVTKKGAQKRKQPDNNWASFLGTGSKKLKTKLDKFKDSFTDEDDKSSIGDNDAQKFENDNETNHNDQNALNDDKIITDTICDVNANKNLSKDADEIKKSDDVNTMLPLLPSSSATTLSVTSSSSSSSCTFESSAVDSKLETSEITESYESKTLDMNAVKKIDSNITNDESTGNLIVNQGSGPIKMMDDESKLLLARKVSLAIMKKSQPGPNADEVESQTSVGAKPDKGAKNKNEVVANVKKSPFNMKLLEEDDVKSKIKQIRETNYDVAQSSIADELSSAVMANDLIKVKFLLAQQGHFKDDDVVGSNLVWSAIKNGYNSILMTLAMNNANIEKRNKDGLTPLLYAADKGLHTAVHLLLELGADLSATSDDGADAMVKAIKGNHKRVVHILLGGGYNLNGPFPPNYQGGTNFSSWSQFCKQLNATDVAEVFNMFKMRLNTELIQKASQSFEGSLKIEQPIFPLQCLKRTDLESFTINFKHELQPTKKQRGMLLFAGHGLISPHEVSCHLKGKSLLTKAILNETNLTSISDDANFVFTFSPLLDGMNKLQIHTQPLSRNDHQTCLFLCAYTITLAV